MKEPLELITSAAALPVAAEALTMVPVPADRLTLAKRRWRGAATDGREFGFDLERPLGDGDAIFITPTKWYRLAQQPEAVLKVTLGDATASARLGWLLGNLHFRIGIEENAVITPDDSAIRQLLDREGILYAPGHRVFRPLVGGHSH